MIRTARESAIARPISFTSSRQVGNSSHVGVRVGDLMADGACILALDTQLEPMNDRQTITEEDISMEGLTAEEYLAQVARETYDIMHSGSQALGIPSNIPLSPFQAPLLYHYPSSSADHDSYHTQFNPSAQPVSEHFPVNSGLIGDDAPAMSIMVDDANSYSSFDIEDLYAAEDEREIVDRMETLVEDDSDKIQEDDLDEPSENIRILSKCRLGLLIRGYTDIISHISIGLG
jgi:hypothetical protein